MRYSFSFRGRRAWNEFGIYARSIDRSLLPAAKKKIIEIPGRDGSYDQAPRSVHYSNRIIQVQLAWPAYTQEAMQAKKREIAAWLTGAWGELVFDDEPDKIWRAKVFEEVSLEPLFVYGAVRVTFECEPFSHSRLHYRDADITLRTQETEVEVGGTHPTPCLIVITNTGTINITNLKITRRGVI